MTNEYKKTFTSDFTDVSVLFLLNLMTLPLYWTKPVKGGFYAKYDFVFKLHCVELYRSGQWPETPEGIGQKNFRKRIVSWAKIVEIHGIDALKHPTTILALLHHYKNGQQMYRSLIYHGENAIFHQF